MNTIHDILKKNQLQIYLQPIVSGRSKKIFGLEALVRGINSHQDILSPLWLFSEAAKADLINELDQKARHMAIQTFYPLWKQNPNLLLFVNFESSLIDDFKTTNYLFDGLLRHYGIPYSNIVLEIKEDHIKSTEKLKSFCHHYRELGFLIALDDFGIGQSSFDRLAIVRPDIIKIDRSLIDDLKENYIHQEIVQAICKMSNNLGALTLAEGVETLEDAVYSKHLGATLLQGFWFGKPSLTPLNDEPLSKIDLVNFQYKDMILGKNQINEQLRQRGEAFTAVFAKTVSKATEYPAWTQWIQPHISQYPDIEAIYLLDENGLQIGNTLLRCKTRMFFEPTKSGCDHSSKEYYIRAKDSRNRFHITNSYLSLASGNNCITYASCIQLGNHDFILCIDFIQQLKVEKKYHASSNGVKKENRDQILMRSSSARVSESTSTFSRLTPVGTPCAIRVNRSPQSLSLSSI